MTRSLKAIIALAVLALVGSCVLPQGSEAATTYDYIAQPGDLILLPDGTVITVGGAPSASPTASPSPVPTPTAVVSASPSLTPSPAPTSSPTPSSTPVPTATATPAPTGNFILADVSGLPTSGTAYDGLRADANSTISPSLSDQDSPANVRTLAAALIYARTGDSAMRTKVIASLSKLDGLGVVRALALGRELAAYVLSADLVRSTDAEVGYDQRAFYKAQLKRATSNGPSNLIACHEERPNNWGTWCGASRIAVDRYIGDSVDLERAAAVFRGWLGDRSAYAGFRYGDTSWQADASKPVGINPAGATKSGHDIDGVLPDDQRRSGSFTWPPPCENYAWEALQGATLQAELLRRAGYPSWQWSDQALRRAVSWLFANGCPASGDDLSTPWVVNYRTASSFRAISPAHAGKGWGYGDWLYR